MGGGQPMDPLNFLCYLHPLKFYSIGDISKMLTRGNKVLLQTKLSNRLKKRAETFTHYKAGLEIDGNRAFAGFLWISSVNDLALKAPPDFGPPMWSSEIGTLLPVLKPKLELLPAVWVPSVCTNPFIGGIAAWEPFPPKTHRHRLNLIRRNKELWGVVK